MFVLLYVGEVASAVFISENLEGLCVMVTGRKYLCTLDTLVCHLTISVPELSTTLLSANPPVNWSNIHTGGSGWFNPHSGPACPLGKTFELV